MIELKICICFFGDGFLCWLCLKYFVVEQVGGDECVVFEFFVCKYCGMLEYVVVNWDVKFINDVWEGW